MDVELKFVHGTCQAAGHHAHLGRIGLLVSLLVMALVATGCEQLDPRPHTPARDFSSEFLLASTKPEQVHYYILIFGSETALREPRHTHTWGTIVKTIQPPDQPPAIAEVGTISWMPATLEIDPLRLTAEKGVNLDLDTTIREMLKHKEKVSLWGPYETWAGLYQRFQKQKVFLDAGKIGYQCIDQIGEARRKGDASNCFHAITDMDPEFNRHQYPLRLYGNEASENIVRQMFARPVLIHPHKTHDWLIQALGLNGYPITVRQSMGPAKEFSPEAIRAERAEFAGTRRPAGASGK